MTRTLFCSGKENFSYRGKQGEEALQHSKTLSLRIRTMYTATNIIRALYYDGVLIYKRLLVRLANWQPKNQPAATQGIAGKTVGYQ